MTKAQRKWLQILNDRGFVSTGTWNSGQRNRPLRALVKMGLAVEGMGPKDSFLKCYGFEPIDKGIQTEDPTPDKT